MITSSQLHDALNWRYATKKFSPAKISDEMLFNILEAGRMAPTSYGLQPVKLWLVTNDEIRAKLRAVGYSQPQITDSSHLIVVASRLGLGEADVTEYMSRITEARGVPAANLDGFKNMIVGDITHKGAEGANNWAARQAYISLGFMLETAALMNVDACPMEGFDTAAFDEILGITSAGFASRAICALGYRDVSDETAQYKKVRKSAEEFIVRVA